MQLFRLVMIFLCLVIYGSTFFVMMVNGVDFLTPFFEALLSGTWQGQFNLDFGMYLLLSALWIMWRSGFSGLSIVLGVLAGSLGMLVFAPYLLWLTRQNKGDFNKLLLGVHAKLRRNGDG